MDKQEYKTLVSDLLKKESELKIQLKNQVKKIISLELENSDLKSKLENYDCHAETDGLEVGSPSDYEINPQLNLFDE